MNDILPPALPILAQLGIEAPRLKFIKPNQRRIHCRAVVDWLTQIDLELVSEVIMG
jgi:hypothetical protein